MQRTFGLYDKFDPNIPHFTLGFVNVVFEYPQGRRGDNYSCQINCLWADAHEKPETWKSWCDKNSQKTWIKQQFRGYL